MPIMREVILPPPRTEGLSRLDACTRSANVTTKIRLTDYGPTSALVDVDGAI